MPNIDLSLMDPSAKKAIQDMAYGEAAGSDSETTKMVIQSALSRYLSGRSDFSPKGGGTISDLVKKGYYAVSNPNTPYKEATSGKFANVKNKARHAEIGTQLDAILGDKDYSKDNAQFYFTPEEEARMRRQGSKAFDFSKVKSKGKVGIYNTYSY